MGTMGRMHNQPHIFKRLFYSGLSRQERVRHVECNRIQR